MLKAFALPLPMFSIIQLSQILHTKDISLKNVFYKILQMSILRLKSL